MDVTVYEFPPELEPYRALILDLDGISIEDVMNMYYNNLNLTGPQVVQAASVQAQITLLKQLHAKRMLRDLSAWVCKTPYPETSKFCGGPNEHPDNWDCGYEKVD